MEGCPEAWCGHKAELLEILGDQVSVEAKRRGDWPASARWFSDRLERAKPGLRSIGISCTERRDSRGVRLTIERIAAAATFATGAFAHSELDLETEAGTDAAGAASAASPANGSDATGPNSVASAARAATVQSSGGLQTKPYRRRL